MPRQNAQSNLDVASPPGWEDAEQRSARYEREFAERRGTGIWLRSALAQGEALLPDKEAVIRQHELMNRECRHRRTRNERHRARQEANHSSARPTCRRALCAVGGQR